MKTLKITLALVAVLLLTVSGVQSENVVVDNEPTYKNYSPKDLLAVDKKKLKVESQG
ncbi:hypothetical protein [Winogradskyella pulchriflava]|uniref:Uncharacterized protein n=1 Tax=Winogradskyella pulchriflava TaxID=1110688 RepID=A0ABV6Q4C3_9FLAO